MRDQLADGVRTYEHRFGRPFLVSIAGRTPAELLVQLCNRLSNDPDAEDLVLAQQLRQLALLDLAARVSD